MSLDLAQSRRKHMESCRLWWLDQILISDVEPKRESYGQTNSEDSSKPIWFPCSLSSWLFEKSGSLWRKSSARIDWIYWHLWTFWSASCQEMKSNALGWMLDYSWSIQWVHHWKFGWFLCLSESIHHVGMVYLESRNLWSIWYLRKGWHQGSSCSRRISASVTCSANLVHFEISSNSWTASLVWAGLEGKRDGPIVWNAYPLHLHLNIGLHRRCSCPRLLGHQLCSDSDFVDCRIEFSVRYLD